MPVSADAEDDPRPIAALRQADIVLYACDTDSRYTWLSDPLFGLDVAAMLGCRDDELLPAEHGAGLAAFKRSVLAEGQPATREITLPFRGARRHYEVRAAPVLDHAGSVIGLSGAVIDITGRKEAEEQAGQAATHAQILARSTREGLLLHDGKQVIEANEAFCRMFRVAREDAIGQDPLRFAAPEARVYAMGQASFGAQGPIELTGLRVDGTTFPVEVSVERFEHQGRMLRVVHVRDLTVQKQAETALRDSEERYRALAAATREGVIIHDGERIVEVNETFCALHGTTRERAIGRPAYEFIAPEARPAAITAIKSRMPAPYETLARREDGTVFPIEASGRPIIYHGRIMRVATIRDLSERIAAEAVLRESEARFRGFAEASNDVMWIIDAASRRLEYLSPAYEEIWGEPRDAISGDPQRWTERVHPDDRAKVVDTLAETLDGQRMEIEYRILRRDGEIRWIRNTGFPIRGADGEIRRAAGLARDITRRKEDENRQRLLLRELNHRVKNTLTTVQSIARQTLRYASDPAVFRDRFEDRLLALSQTHNLLTRENWARASLRSLLKQELRPHGKGRYELSGDEDVHLAPRAVVALGMALHELTTNAAKYGALSVPAGCVQVNWRVVEGPTRRLQLRWSERGGPPIITPPPRRGFGSRLLERGITAELDGTVALDFTPAGLEALIEIPLEPPNIPGE